MTHELTPASCAFCMPVLKRFSGQEVILQSTMQVVELEVYMTPAMEEIYQAISELMDACVKELRKSNKIDTSELTVENGIFRSFDDIIRRQLDSIWHTVSARTKQVKAYLDYLGFSTPKLGQAPACH